MLTSARVTSAAERRSTIDPFLASDAARLGKGKPADYESDQTTHFSVIDAAGNAVITLGNGQAITLEGVHAVTLTAVDFVFEQTPVTNNIGAMTIGDGAMLPISGIINNTGTIALNSAGAESDLELIQHGITLQGGGHVILSDMAGNVIFGTANDVTLTNVDNTISGAGQIGASQMALNNQGTVIADGSHALAIDTGANAVLNSGTLEATGTGGLTIAGALNNSGSLWAHGGNLVIHGAVTGSGTALIDGNGTLEFGAASSANTTFAADAAGMLKLDDSFHFSGTVAGFGAGDRSGPDRAGRGAADTTNGKPAPAP
jgi:hypothetical protein